MSELPEKEDFDNHSLQLQLTELLIFVCVVSLQIARVSLCWIVIVLLEFAEL